MQFTFAWHSRSHLISSLFDSFTDPVQLVPQIGWTRVLRNGCFELQWQQKGVQNKTSYQVTLDTPTQLLITMKPQTDENCVMAAEQWCSILTIEKQSAVKAMTPTTISTMSMTIMGTVHLSSSSSSSFSSSVIFSPSFTSPSFFCPFMCVSARDVGSGNMLYPKLQSRFLN